MNYKLIENLGSCREAIESLSRNEVIFVDAEGVNLGKLGTLTLLQIGTKDGLTYLFDIQADKRMFRDGGLKSVLENKNILKVFHACKWDSEALNHHFDVTVNNVFDTQIADMIIQEKSGRLIPTMRKLSELSKMYGVQSLVNKEEIQKSWSKTVANYWELRPFTSEMIEYACNDVVVLPELYIQLKGLLEKEGLMDLFNERVFENIHYLLDDKIKDQRNERVTQNAKLVLKKIDREYSGVVEYDSITDEDFQAALLRHWKEEDINIYMTPKVRNIFYKAVLHELQEIEKEMDTTGQEYNPDRLPYFFLSRCTTYTHPSIKAKGTRLLDRYQSIIFNDMNKKYTTSSPLYLLRENEIMLLKMVRIKNARDALKYSPVIVHFKNKLTEQEFKDFRKKLQTNPSQVSVNHGFYTFLGYQVAGSHLPAYVRLAAKELKDAIDRSGKKPIDTRAFRIF